MRVAIYARVSKADQTAENQLLELRRYITARGWTPAGEYVDHGVSGAKDRRPALDDLTAIAKRHTIDAVVCWSLDRLGRNLRHLVMLMDEWRERGIVFATMREGIDTSTPSGRMAAGLFGVFAEFERARIQERVHAGLSRARAQGKVLGRRTHPNAGKLAQVAGRSHAEAAGVLGVSVATVKRWRRQGGSKSPTESPDVSPRFAE